MKISEEGYKKVKNYEGYHRALPDGSCTAYQTRYRGKLDVPTIGWGCTSGVKMGMVWSKQQAEEGLRREMAKFEDAVTRLVTVPLNQNEYDALCLLTYNIGETAFAKSTCLKRLNKNDRKGAAEALQWFNKVGAYTEPGLVQRRASEAALFMKPVAAPEEPAMPQGAIEAKPVSKTTAAAAASTAAVVVTQTLPGLPIPSVPPEIADSVANVSIWKDVGEQVWALKDWAVSQPLLAGALSLSITGFWLWSKKKAAP